MALDPKINVNNRKIRKLSSAYEFLGFFNEFFYIIHKNALANCQAEQFFVPPY